MSLAFDENSTIISALSVQRKGMFCKFGLVLQYGPITRELVESNLMRKNTYGGFAEIGMNT